VGADVCPAVAQSAYWRSSSVSVAKHRAGQKPLLR